MKIKETTKKIVKMNNSVYKLVNWSFEHLKPISVPSHYPTNLNFELTTICNSRCTFCTHENLIRSGVKKARHMDYKFARYIMEQFREMTKGIPDEEINFSPVGLGEPLLHPRFFDVISFARELFPGASIHANTNCIALTDKIAEKLIDCGLDSLRLSLCFNNAKTYYYQCGVDKYDICVENIKNFLRLKEDRPPRANIQIFAMPANKGEFHSFMEKWSHYLNKNDSIVREQFLPLTDWSKKDYGWRRYPCYQLWSVIMVDITGYVYPCCIGTWIPKDDDLCLGHISDDFSMLLKRVEEVRRRHINGKWGVCDGCPVLYEMRGHCKRFYNKVKSSGR